MEKVTDPERSLGKIADGWVTGMLRGKPMNCYRHEWDEPITLIREFDDDDSKFDPPEVKREHSCIYCGKREIIQVLQTGIKR